MKFAKKGNYLIGRSGLDTIWIEPWGENSLRVRMTKEATMDTNDWALIDTPEDISVAPIFELAQRSREVYLPKNQLWKNAKSNEIIEGGQTVIVDAPINEIPLFIRAEKDYPIY